MFVCPNCSRSFQTAQGHNHHYAICTSKMSHKRHKIPKPKKIKLVDESDKIREPSEIPLQHLDLLQPQNDEPNCDDNSSFTSETSGVTADIMDKNLVLNLAPRQKILLQQETMHQRKISKTKMLWSNNDLVRLDLLKILQKHNCHNSAFKDILEWHEHYQHLHTTSPPSQYEKTTMQREQFIASLEKRFDMSRMKPTVHKLHMSDTEYISISVFDFQQQLLSILRDKELMHQSNLVVDAMVKISNGYKSPKITDIQDGEWYSCALNHYKELYGDDPHRLVCGIILTVDKTHTDWKGKLCLEPVQFTLSIFNKEVRKRNSKCWRCLGYINDMEGYDIKKFYTDKKRTMNKKYHSDRSQYDLQNRDTTQPSILENDIEPSENILHEEDLNQKSGIQSSYTEKKSKIYHQILNVILRSMKESQDIGLAWNIEFSSGQKRLMKMYFPLCLCVVDMKGARQLCGMYDSAATNMKRPCISCDCDNENLDNENFKCKPVLHDDILKTIMDEEATKQDYQHISQHRNECNVFFNMNLGGWKYGIWGLCPSEILHQFYEGVVGYLLEEFLENFLTPRYQLALTKGVGMIIQASKNLGCSNEYPTGTFSMGINKFNKMKGIEKFGCLFYLCIFLHTGLIETKYFEGEDSLTEPMKSSNNFYSLLKSWRNLFEQCLYYHDWTMKPNFSKDDLKVAQHSIKKLHRSLKKHLNRDGKGIKSIPKIHEFFHVTRNILWHGPPIGYDTRPTESNLKVHKRMAQNTQRQISSFSHQTASCLHENTVIRESVANIQRFSTKMLCNNQVKKKQPIDLHQRTSINEKKSISRHYFFAIYNKEQSSVGFFKEKDGKTPILNTEHFNDEIKLFLKERIFLLLANPERDNCIKCCENIIRQGISFRGYSTTDDDKYPGWAMIQWVDSQCPAQILFYMYLHNLDFNQENRLLYRLPCQYAVIRSLQCRPICNNTGNHRPVCRKVQFENVPHKYRIVSERTFVGSCFVIPNFGKDGIQKNVLYFFPRNYDGMQNNCGEGWFSKF